MAETIRIPLRRRDGTVRAYALIDAGDAAQAEHRWCLLGKSGYAYRMVARRTVLLHREILGLPREWAGLDGDHIDGNRLDNRRLNLRVVTRAGNLQNVAARPGSSKYRGVSWDETNGKWRAYAGLAGRFHHIGRFASEDEAAEAARLWRLAHMPFTTER